MPLSALASGSLEALSESIFQTMFLVIQVGSALSLFAMAVVLGIKSIFNTRTVNYWYSFILAIIIGSIMTGIEFWYLGGIE